jgi:hypothetical protein
MMHRAGMAVLFLLIQTGSVVFSQSILLDDFESIVSWEVFASDGVRLSVSQDNGVSGQAIRLDYSFDVGAGFCGIRKSFNHPLTDNYRLIFYTRGEGKKNNFEFKLLDRSGDNVWWHNRRNYTLPNRWERLESRKRHIEFAWGPDAGELDTLHTLEFVIAAGEGGSGTVYIDMLYFEPLSVIDFRHLRPSAIASSSAGAEYEAGNVLNSSANAYWQSKPVTEPQWLRLDLGEITEIGGLIIDWHNELRAVDYNIRVSTDAVLWENVYVVRDGLGTRDYVYIPEMDARYVELDLIRSRTDTGYAIFYLDIQPVTFSQTPNHFFRNVARSSQRGAYPRYLYNEQSYWTVVGADSDGKEALLNEDGLLEVEKEMFSIEPFLYLNEGLITWADVEISHSLLEDYLPIPSVHWRNNGIEFSIRAVARGERSASSVLVSYTITNPAEMPAHGSLYLALRPFQVNPPWQFLNITGGFAPIYTLEYNNNDGTVTVNSTKKVISLTRPDTFGATGFDQADITEYLSQGIIPEAGTINDERGFASGVLEYTFSLSPGEKKTVIMEIPFYRDSPEERYTAGEDETIDYFNKTLHGVADYWRNRLNPVEFIVPEHARKYIDVLRSNLAYILINRDGPAIQPGSRSYERSWIRDGSLTSGALLRLGLHEPVREFIEWYAPYQYDNGKIPCVVDRRGPDPVDEHDSPGQFIYAIMEYFLFTNDTSFLEQNWDRVKKTVDYIEYLINQRKTEEYRSGDRYKRAFYGLVPESISHEGYADKPMHSYWDNFFILKGLKDAADMASVLGHDNLVERYGSLKDEFRKNLYSSILLAMDISEIDYIPGCVELGDFDATSTTIGIFPCGELEHIPRRELNRTFEKYLEHFNRRLDPAYEWNDYTPYEIRAAGTFIFRNQRERTHKLLDFFFNDLRPYNWNHWAEVVWRDFRKPRFIGDMPHTWVGSDYINVVRNMFIYDRRERNAVVLAAGIPETWFDTDSGVGVMNMPTYYGELNYYMQRDGNNIKAFLSGDFDVNAGIIIIKSPRDIPIRGVVINGEINGEFDDTEVTVTRLPAEVVLQFE